MTQTRQQAHATATELLAQASALMDQAHALFRDAKTEGFVETGFGPSQVTARRATFVLESLVDAAREAQCENCGKTLAQCQCAWLQTSVR